MQLRGPRILELKDSRMGFGGDIVSGVAKESIPFPLGRFVHSNAIFGPRYYCVVDERGWGDSEDLFNNIYLGLEDFGRCECMSSGLDIIGRGEERLVSG
jgi:hypothetical protein